MSEINPHSPVRERDATPKVVTESSTVLAAIAAQTGLRIDEVGRLVAACRDAVDELIAEDFSIVAPPLLFATTDDPVFEALGEKLMSCSDAEAQSCMSWDNAVLAEWLGVSEDQLERHPIAT